MDKKLYKSIDLTKFISAFAVVCLHTQPFINTAVEYFANTFFVMAVPFFFCTSSFFFHRKEISLRHYIKRLSLLYLIWFVIEIPYLLNKFDFSSLSGLKFFVWSLFFQNTFWASWFLMALMIAMLIVVPLNRKGHTTLLYTIGVLCFILSLFASMYNGLVSYLPCSKAINAFLYYISAAQSFVLAIPYCILGIKLVDTDFGLTIKKELFILLLLIALTIIEAYLCMPICSRLNASLLIIPVVFMVVYVCLRHDINIPSKLVVFLRKSSILIYLIHCIVLHLLMKYAELDFGFSLMLYTSLISLALGIIIVYLSKYIKPLKYLY